jgi:hypothetical protein
MGIIAVQKSFIKGLSSIVTVISFDKLGAGIATDNKKLVAKKATEVKKSGAKKATYPINLNSKEDLQEDDPDSLLKIDQAIEKKPMKNSLNSLPDILSLYTSSKESNSNNSVINVLPAGPTATGNNKFTALGNILAAASVVTAPAVLSKKAISLGRSILLKKGFSSSEVQLITDRITASMTGKDIKSKDKYFLAACNKEVRKGSSLAGSVHKSTGGALVVRDLQVKAKAAAAVEEKQAPPAVEVIERIKTIAPTELFEVIMTVDSDEKTQKALRFFSSDIVKKEILASHYLAAFKKEFPEIKIC